MPPKHHSEGTAASATAEVRPAALSLEQQVGQLLAVGFAGPALDAGVARLIAERHVGGVVLFARNCASPQQVRLLCRELQALSALPLFVAVDQEGGTVARLQHPVTVFPSNMALGATRRPENAYRAALYTAQTLAALGINVNFAPAVDVNNNPQNPVIGVRSYGEDAGLVAEMGAAAVQGYREGGVLATAKHFPGHGDTALDSHLALPVVGCSLERLEAVELPPFRAAIVAGVDLIMTSHVKFPVLGARHPSTMAPEVLTGLLRRRLGYNGVICTDCMEMQAVAANYDVGEAAVLAIEAGSDLVLVSHRLDRQTAALDALLAACRSGRLSAQRVEESVARIRAAKAHVAARQQRHVTVGGFPVAEHEAAAMAMARAATTLLKNDGHLLPLRAERIVQPVLIEFSVGQAPQVEENREQPSLLAQMLRVRLPSLRALTVGATPTESEMVALQDTAQGAEVVLYATRNAFLNPRQAAAVRAALAGGQPGIVLALRGPYDLMLFPEAAAHLATYGDPPCSLRAVCDIVLGEAAPAGLLPVTLPGAYPLGAGLSLPAESY